MWLKSGKSIGQFAWGPKFVLLLSATQNRRKSSPDSNMWGTHCCNFMATMFRRTRRNVTFYVPCLCCFISRFLFPPFFPAALISLLLIIHFRVLTLSLSFLLYSPLIPIFTLYSILLFFSSSFIFSRSVFLKVIGLHFLQNTRSNSLCPSYVSSRYVWVSEECSWCVWERDAEIYVWRHGHHASSL